MLVRVHVRCCWVLEIELIDTVLGLELLDYLPVCLGLLR